MVRRMHCCKLVGLRRDCLFEHAGGSVAKVFAPAPGPATAPSTRGMHVLEKSNVVLARDEQSRRQASFFVNFDARRGDVGKRHGGRILVLIYTCYDVAAIIPYCRHYSCLTLETVLQCSALVQRNKHIHAHELQVMPSKPSMLRKTPLERNFNRWQWLMANGRVV
jgi:hypothetical protein